MISDEQIVEAVLRNWEKPRNEGVMLCPGPGSLTADKAAAAFRALLRDSSPASRIATLEAALGEAPTDDEIMAALQASLGNGAGHVTHSVWKDSIDVTVPDYWLSVFLTSFIKARLDAALSSSPPGMVVVPAGLRTANAARQAEWDQDNQISLTYRATELAGEVGEACNIIKKLEREKLGIRGSRATKQDLADELADVVICADLIAMGEGIDLLGEAVPTKFNATSDKYGLQTHMLAASPAQAKEGG